MPTGEGMVKDEPSIARGRGTAQRGSRCGVVLAVLIVASPWGGEAALGETSSRSLPIAVQAKYRLRYNGIDIGHIEAQSNTAEKTYTISGSGKVSVLFGAITWSGASNVAGNLVAGTPHPTSYALEWRNNRKGGTIRMGYKGRVATDVTVTPPPEPHVDLVPLLPAHKTDAFDPVSALLMLTRADGRAPCERRVEIFDGKQRYALDLSFKRHVELPNASASSGPAEIAHACRVMYVPIAGHRANAATKTYASNSNVEVVMRLIPGSEVLIPYSVTVPTFWGTGSMVTERIEVTMATGSKVAFGK